MILLAAGVLAACGGDGGQDADPNPAALTTEGWDSQDHNPTHATHSYLTEFAADQVQGDYPELQAYRASLVDGANREIHDLKLTDPEQEALRIEVGGTNAGCEHPERVWSHVVASYGAGDRTKAYWYLGILLHYVEDLGIPAHALGVYHQASLSQLDHFELMALQRWSPSYAAIDRTDPALANPADYVAFSQDWTASDWRSTFPGVSYTRTYYASSWLWAPSREKTYMHDREGRTAMVAAWALGSAMRALQP